MKGQKKHRWTNAQQQLVAVEAARIEAAGVRHTAIELVQLAQHVLPRAVQRRVVTHSTARTIARHVTRLLRMPTIASQRIELTPEFCEDLITSIDMIVRARFASLLLQSQKSKG